MFLGIIVLEIPSSLLQSIGPEKWMPAQVLAFGIITIYQIFLHNRTVIYTEIMIALVASGLVLA
ncbi:hypothetical protein EYZ11_011069 [Aspergillus tanneri]|uniref:Uncharacterized protein n=1 Tax=Aspergillus tanneri TaxID=1220188 RepID=A0A4S3J428_9EURO|nr:hypothetical protein EYZ11_011069 [Aspergillus tanneri]